MKNERAITRRLNELYDHVGEHPTPEQSGQMDALGWVLGEADSILEDENAKADSDDAIRKAIEELKASKKKYPEYSLFGDPNWRVADAQVAILEWVLEP